MSGNNETDTLAGDDRFSEEYRKLDVALQLLIQENHPRVMNLEEPIPREYPWEDFLKRHFANPPFELQREDYEYVILGNHTILKIRDSRKPTTFYGLLRYLEFFRSKLGILDRNVSAIEQQHDRLKNTANERVGLRAIMTGNQWDYDSIANKHLVIKNALDQKTKLEDILKKLQTILAKNLNVTSRWQYLIQPFYEQIVAHINSNFADGSFNLRMFYPVKTMEKMLAPYYGDSMKLTIELVDAVQQTTEFVKNRGAGMFPTGA